MTYEEMEKYDFKYYAINWSRNKDELEWFNIFDNYKVFESAIKLCNDYWKGKYTYSEFVKELDSIIKWQEWSRCEYEVVVTRFPPAKNSAKVDTYSQAHQNINMIADSIIKEYKKVHPRKKQIIK